MNLTPAIYREMNFTEPITANGAGVEFVGCRFERGLVWMGSGAGRVVECVFYASASGHGLYTHNTGGGVREISRCLFMPYPGRFGLHIYSGGANWLRDYHVTDCVHLAPVQVGGGYGVRGLVYQGNMHISTHAGFGTYSGAAGNTGEIACNRFINPSGVAVLGGFTCHDNDYLTVTAQRLPRGFSLVALPRDWSAFIPFEESTRYYGIEARCYNGIASASLEPVRRYGATDIISFILAAGVNFRRRGRAV